MICPQCRAEYRQGFTRCADCDVALIPSPPESEADVSRAVRAGSLVRLWEGEDLALHVKLREALDEAGIPYYDKPLGSYLSVHRDEPWPFYSRPKFGFEIAVLSSDSAAAKEILEKLLEEEPEDIALRAEDHMPAPVLARESPDGGEASSEIWDGDDERLAGFLRDALSENEILVHVETSAEGTKIYVGPGDESRAREIVREIVEGAPPE